MESDNKPFSFLKEFEALLSKIWSLRGFYLKLWIIVFVSSCLFILIFPRTYKCEVMLAPEESGSDLGGLASIASSFGVNLGSSSDAIRPSLYPDLMETNEFIVDIMHINVKTLDGRVDTDYYTYLRKHQKKNWLTYPFTLAKQFISDLLTKSDKPAGDDVDDVNPFMLSRAENELALMIKDNISCSINKRTSVITITVADQDRLVCATLAESVRDLLQQYITDYRTKKASIDAMYYKSLADSTKVEYDRALELFTTYTDSHQNAALQSIISERDRLQKDVDLKYNTYRTMITQYEAMKAKVQEQTPAFAVLKSASVPVKADKPKRVKFVLFMLVLSTIVGTFWKLREEFLEWF